jgi:hypothetical protein
MLFLPSAVVGVTPKSNFQLISRFDKLFDHEALQGLMEEEIFLHDGEPFGKGAGRVGRGD